VLARHVDRLSSAQPRVAEVERDELSRSEELIVAEPALARTVDRRLDDESVVSAVIAYDSAHDAAALAHAAPRAHHEHDVDGDATRHGSLLEPRTAASRRIIMPGIALHDPIASNTPPPTPHKPPSVNHRGLTAQIARLGAQRRTAYLARRGGAQLKARRIAIAVHSHSRSASIEMAWGTVKRFLVA
jgi:hypothetical protein